MGCFFVLETLWGLWCFLARVLQMGWTIPLLWGRGGMPGMTGGGGNKKWW